MQEIIEASPADRLQFHHPNVVLRVAGLPFSMAQRLTTGTSHALALRLDAMRRSAADATARACGYLESAIGSAEFSQEERRRLLALKRNLFNGKRHDRAAVADVLARLSPEANASIAGASAVIAEIAEAEASFDAVFGAEANEGSARLRALSLESEEFMRGLAFSAPLVANDLIDTVKHPEKFTGKRGRQLDLGLYNYFIRAVTKVSPLSYFTPALIGRFVDDGGAAPLSLGDRDVLSVVELARHALDHLFAEVAKSLKLWGDAHPLILNPTLKDTGTLLSFSDIWARGPSNERTWGIVQPVVQLPVNSRIAALRQLYGPPENGASFTLAELYGQLGNPLSGGDQAKFAAYIGQAMRVGLLLPKMDVYEQEDGAQYLLRVLADRAPQAAERLRSMLDALEGYASCPHDERLPRAKTIGEQFTALSAELDSGQQTQRAEVKALFSEDCYLSGPPLDVPAHTLGSALDDLHRLSTILPLLDYTHVVQSVMAALFVRRYGAHGVTNAMDCLDSIANEGTALAQGLSILPLEQQVAQMKPLSETGHALLHQKRLLLEALHAKIRSTEPVTLDDAFFAEFARGIPGAVRARPTSYTVIGQVNDSEAQRRFVLNRLYSGHSMLQSRFLLQLEDSEVRHVSTYLAKLSAGHKLVEIPGVFGFNANLHPQLVDAELVLPGRRPSYRDSEKIDVTSLSIHYDREVDRLAVAGPGGDAHAMHYFGFLNTMALPSIYQMLGRMQLQGLVPDTWQELYFAGYLDPKEFATRLARVSYRGIVLSRQSVFLPATSLPPTDVPAPVFFREFYNLMQRLSVSGDQFVRLVAQREDFTATTGERSEALTTAFKPSFFSFDIPLTVSGLQRRLQKRRRSILFQECLPAIGESGVTWRNEKHACEMQFEISQTPETCR